MAAKNRTDLTPEIKVARLLLQRENLSPPVPVLDLLGRYADIERVHLGFSTVDGFTYRKPKSARPGVILNIGAQNSNRERFTAAHELGHIILPWQFGTVYCHTDDSVTASDSAYGKLEAEANQFAGELLLPGEWAEQQLGSMHGALARRIIEVAQIAEVSPLVATLSISRILHDGILFVTKNGRTMMNVYGSTFGQWGRKEWSVLLKSDYERQGAVCTSETFGPYELHCVEFSLPLRQRPMDPSTDILGSIVFKAKDKHSLERQINGIIGYANSQVGSDTPESIYRTLKLRFTNRPELAEVVNHPRFDDFLLAKAFELSERRNLK